MSSVAIAAPINPYPGLVPFDETSATRCFGRDNEIEDVLERLAHHRLLAVIGVSGCGKSSIVRAGVQQILSVGVAENLPGPWKIKTINPGNAPLQSLRSALGASEKWPATSFDFATQARSILAPGEKLLLIVDQFEELFSFRARSQAKDAGNEAALFVNLLLNAVNQREAPVHILLTMRSDFLGECAQFRGLPEALNDCYYLVPRMTRSQQQEAIEGPLQQQRSCMTPALVQQLLNDSSEDPDELPVLQHLLRRLWEQHATRALETPIDLDDYLAVGGWQKALNNDAEAVVAKFPAEAANIKRLFQWITDRGNGEKPVRRPRPLDECAGICGISPVRLSHIVTAFQQRGLLKQTDLSDSSLVDLPHESVMWHWVSLQRWIGEEAQRGAQLRFLLQSARQAVPISGLALESALTESATWRSQPGLASRYLKPDELAATTAWIQESSNRRQKSKWRRILTWIAVPAVALILLLLFLVIGKVDTDRSLAEARELSAWSAVSLNENLQRSLILGVLAWNQQKAMPTGLDQIFHDALGKAQGISRLELSGHQGPINQVAWFPDGKKVATASNDGTTKTWDAGTGRLLETIVEADHKSMPPRVGGWPPDSPFFRRTLFLLSEADADSVLKSHDAATVSKLAAWSPNGKFLAFSPNDNTVRVWTYAGKEAHVLTGHHQTVQSIAWSVDEGRLATASLDGTAKVWDASTGLEVLALQGKSPLNDIAWSPDGTKLITGGEDHTANIWELSFGGELLTWHANQSFIENLAWSNDGSRIATAGADHSVKILDVSTTHERAFPLPDVVTKVAWSADGNKLAASTGRMAVVISSSSGQTLLTLQGHQDRVTSIAWSPGDNRKLATSSWDRTAKSWDAITGKDLLTFRGHTNLVESAVFSPDGTKLATSSADRTAIIWDAATASRLVTCKGHSNSVLKVAWSPDGKRLATASADNTGAVWDAASGRQLFKLTGHQNYLYGVAWSPDGTKLATASADDTVKVWEASTGFELLTLHGFQSPVRSVAWSPDGKRLAAAGEDSIMQIYAIDPMQLVTLASERITRTLDISECKKFLGKDSCPALPKVK